MNADKLYYKEKKDNNYCLSSAFSKTYKSDNTGNDERYPINETNNQTQLYNINKNYEKKKLLDILKNDKISINTKLKLLEDNSIKPINLKAGGLLDDFNFTLNYNSSPVLSSSSSSTSLSAVPVAFSLIYFSIYL